jgi:hypothetical protein
MTEKGGLNSELQGYYDRVELVRQDAFQLVGGVERRAVCLAAGSQPLVDRPVP